MAWDDEKVKKLVTLWNDGHSASACGRVLGATREAVTGKVDRLRRGGVRLRQGDDTVARQSHMQLAAARSKVVPLRPKIPQQIQRFGFGATVSSVPVLTQPIAHVEELVIPVAERKTLDMLENHHCRWPIGEPQEADFHFCGKNKAQGLNYCEHHARRAFLPPPQTRAGGSLVARRTSGAQKSEKPASGQNQGVGDGFVLVDEPETVS